MRGDLGCTDEADRADRLVLAPGTSGAALPPDIVHDLLQPLTGILVLTDPAEACAADGSDRLQQVHALAAWMEELLGSSCEDCGASARRDRAVNDAMAVCRSVVAGCHGAGPVLTLRGPEAPASVRVRAVDLRRILGNVVDNAMRAAGPRGHVDVGLVISEGQVVIDVADDGPGFGRIPRHGGCGLSIVRELVTRHSGGLQITDDPDGGVHVTISLPVTRVPLRRSAS
jgi:signal transduction histidine kinase